MSDLPGEMTKQILSAPPRIIRSMRYSLTARGRSISPSRRLPTGSSSLENASGWILLPTPAAGMMPHMLTIECLRGAGRPRRPRLLRGTLGRIEYGLQLDGTVAGRVRCERALAGGAGDPG